MEDAEKTRLIVTLAKSLERDLLGLYGPVMTGEELHRALGYPSREAFRQSLVRNKVGVPLFDFEYRRGKFALVKDVARYLAELRFSSTCGNFEDFDQGGEP